MSIDSLLEAITGVSGVETGFGPERPLMPGPLYETCLQEELRKYPVLESHPDFIKFLKRYAGAIIHQDETTASPWWGTEIFGIGEWGEMGDPVDAEGFYCFALVGTGSNNNPSFEQMQAVFAFDATGKRLNVVYVAVGPVDQSTEEKYRIYCDTFAEWLQRFIEADGRLMPESDEKESALAEVGSSEGA